MIITIDGPSGTGKSTIARKIAEKLQFAHFDTGAMYRAVTLEILTQGISLQNSQSVENLLASFTFTTKEINGKKHYFIKDQDVSKEIRSSKIDQMVSEVSATPSVREALWRMQREYAEKQNAVFEGRDMGTIVFPKAFLKVFLDAKAKVRAKRRFIQQSQTLSDKAAALDEEVILEEILKRDQYDSTRELAPLKCPRKALYIDTSDLTVEEVVDKIIEEYSRKAKKLLPTWRHAKNLSFLYRACIFLAWVAARIFYRHRVYGLEHYTDSAAIIAPNHTSYLDPPLTSISWPNQVHFLAKQSLFRPFLFGSLIRALNSHPVHSDVGDVGVFKTILQLLKEGKQIILFPEGQRTSGEFGEIKLGIAMLALRSKAVIIPTYIHGSGAAWGADRKWPKLFAKTACVFGSGILLDPASILDKREAQQQIAEKIFQSLQQLKAWYLAGAKGIPP